MTQGRDSVLDDEVLHGARIPSARNFGAALPEVGVLRGEKQRRLAFVRVNFVRQKPAAK